MDDVEDYWERGPGRVPPVLSAHNHALAVYGWDLRDALSLTYAKCEERIRNPKDNLITQFVENANDRAATYVYPDWPDEAKALTLFDAARELGADHDAQTDSGIETLIVFLGANNALRTVVDLEVRWSRDDFRDLDAKKNYTVWCPSHFAAEFAEIVAAVKNIEARHVIFATVPHVTIPPISRGIGQKVRPGSQYFPHYTRPWISEQDFKPGEEPPTATRQFHSVTNRLPDRYARLTMTRLIIATWPGRRCAGSCRPPCRWRSRRRSPATGSAGSAPSMCFRRSSAKPGHRTRWPQYRRCSIWSTTAGRCRKPPSPLSAESS